LLRRENFKSFGAPPAGRRAVDPSEIVELFACEAEITQLGRSSGLSPTFSNFTVISARKKVICLVSSPFLQLEYPRDSHLMLQLRPWRSIIEPVPVGHPWQRESGDLRATPRQVRGSNSTSIQVEFRPWGNGPTTWTREKWTFHD